MQFWLLHANIQHNVTHHLTAIRRLDAETYYCICCFVIAAAHPMYAYSYKPLEFLASVNNGIPIGVWHESAEEMTSPF